MRWGLAAGGVVVATGGYGGAMEAVSSGAAASGGRVIGVTAPAVFPHRAGPNSHVTEERPADTLGSRIEDLVSISEAAIALPGSLGTATELLVAWNVAYVARFSDRSPKPVIAVGDPWQQLVPHLSRILGTDGALVITVETVDDAVTEVLRRIGV
jgi:predicted Rossmann-fold nucleotide-binding protein